MTTHSQAHWQGSVFCLMYSHSTLMLGSNLLRQSQGFEMGIKDCVLTKKEYVSVSLPKNRVSVFLSYKSEEKFVFHSEN